MTRNGMRAAEWPFWRPYVSIQALLSHGIIKLIEFARLIKVLPGFIDGHMHTACNIMRGLAQDTNSWMMFGLHSAVYSAKISGRLPTFKILPPSTAIAASL